MGGRRPKHPSNLSPEEEAKRKVRRERNKLAAGKNFFFDSEVLMKFVDLLYVHQC